MPWMEGRVRHGLGVPRVTARSPEALGMIVRTIGAIMAEHGLEKECPQSFSVTAATLRVDTPCIYISMRESTGALSDR